MAQDRTPETTVNVDVLFESCFSLDGVVFDSAVAGHQSTSRLDASIV